MERNINEKENNMSGELAKEIVVDYYNKRVEKTDQQIGTNDAYVVWFAYVLGNWKALVSTAVDDGMYYEVTARADGATYLDAYKKLENVVIGDQQ